MIGKMIEYQIIEKNAQNITVELVFPANHDFFDGHFDTMKILPAVAQLFIVEQIAQDTWGTLLGLKKMKQVKFKAPVFPGVMLNLSIILVHIDNEVELSFRFHSGENLKSSGKLVYQKPKND